MLEFSQIFISGLLLFWTSVDTNGLCVPKMMRGAATQHASPSLSLSLSCAMQHTEKSDKVFGKMSPKSG